jgi:hypothetical protein
VPTTTTRLGLKKFAGADFFHITDWDDNSDLLDLYPGVYICDAASRPTTWGPDQNGMWIYEADTKLVWKWNGSYFERDYPKGWLGGAVRTTPFSTVATTFDMVTQVAIDIPNSYPPGSRRYAVTVEGPSVDNDGTTPQVDVGIFRDTTQLQAFTLPVVGGVPGPLSFTTYDRTVGADTSVTYSLQVKANIPSGGTVDLDAAIDTPIAIEVYEL